MILFLLIANSSFAQVKSGKILVNDFKAATGYWKGKLTYLDYTSGKPYTMSADQAIQPIKGTFSFAISNIYPLETDANSQDTLNISADGKMINDEKVQSRTKLPNGNIEIVTTESGTDGNDDLPATFRHTYTLGKTTFTKKKEVQFVGSTEWIKRHEYVFERE